MDFFFAPTWLWQQNISIYDDNNIATYWGLNKMAAILKMTFSKVFSLMKIIFSLDFLTVTTLHGEENPAIMP